MDSLALKNQLERYHAESYGWALSCCSRDPREAEDVLQTVYLKILEGKARYDGKATFKTWLFSVIRNTAADVRRRTVLDRLRLIKYGSEVGQSGREDRLDHEISHSRVTVVLEAFANLPRRQREILQLVFYHSLSLHAAAEVMQVSIGTARTHYERGKKRIRQQIEGATTDDESRLGREGTRGAIPRPAEDG
jgi:RNA polymerase sigma-70 factor (ECF subfamily)